MKNTNKWIILLLSIFIAPTEALLAQQLLEVTVVAPEAQNSQSYYTVDIRGTSLSQVQKDWKNYVQKGSNGDGNMINGEYVQTGVVNKSISMDGFTAHAGFQQMTESVQLKVWLKQNNLPFPDNNQEAVKKFVRDFAVVEYRNYTSERIDIEKSKLNSMENKLASLNKTENKTIKQSGQNTRSNERSAESIDANKTAIENSSQKIDSQDDMINKTSSDKNANDGAKKTLKELEDDKKDLEKENEKEGRRIENRNEQNRENDRDMTMAQTVRDRLEKDIEAQKLVVLNLQQELSRIN